MYVILPIVYIPFISLSQYIYITVANMFNTHVAARVSSDCTIYTMHTRVLSVNVFTLLFFCSGFTIHIHNNNANILFNPSNLHSIFYMILGFLFSRYTHKLCNSLSIQSVIPTSCRMRYNFTSTAAITTFLWLA